MFSLKSFLTRIGRTGRIGHRGKSITFIDPNGVDYKMCTKFADQVRNAGQTPPEWLVKMGQDGPATDSRGGGFDDDRGNRRSAPPPANDDGW